MSFYGDDYQEVMQEKKKEQLAKNDEYINYIKQKGYNLVRLDTLLQEQLEK